MNIYRIEHKDLKIGPYQGGALFDDGYYYGKNCPGPVEDGISGIDESYRFGFAYMKHLLHWFRFRDIFRMRKKGFRVYRFRANEDYIKFGYSQAAFVRAKAYSKVEVSMSVLAKHMVLDRLSSLRRCP